ncbi:hypothetical protein Lfu02_06780 [Longispora fulva]|uniref:PBP domain-containing protein n=1 Tax=Longispora fulva TaxID=619741 RepID=A0A8J7GR65_9ACTN|nr:hypothetical protein [Longispora fulva]MBG6135451.1 hypothetical protein [Longispora fulva]GIG56306.1 hypothetical protein Lfu02_06780 [Longispora fulva]
MKLPHRTLVPLLAAVLATATGTPAAADPATGTYATLAGLGSATTDHVQNALAGTIGGGWLATWNARYGSDTIQTRATGCEFPRPRTPADARLALRASHEGRFGARYRGLDITGCVDFVGAAAYDPDVPAFPAPARTLTYVPFGVDALSYAVSNHSDLPDNLTFVQLQRIYRCLTSAVGGVAVTPLLTPPGSDTRTVWLERMGVSEADLAAGDYPCLGRTIEEHDAVPLAGHVDHLMPFAASQWIAQQNAAALLAETGVVISDRRAGAVLGRVDGRSPVSAAGTQDLGFQPRLQHDVYTVVPSDLLDSPYVSHMFVGPNAAVCEEWALIRKLGFGFRYTTVDATHQGCGDAVHQGN